MKVTVPSGSCIVLVGAVLSGGAVAQAAERVTPATANPCIAGDALLKSHRLADANTFYSAALKRRPTLVCAQFGLAAVAGERAVANEKEKQGKDAVKEAARLRETAKEPPAGAEPKPEEQQKKPAAPADAESEAVEQERIAIAAYTEALAHDAGRATASKELARLSPDEAGWLRGFGEWIDSSGKSLKKSVFDRADEAGRIVVVVAALLLAAAILGSLALRWLIKSKRFGRCLHSMAVVRRFVRRPLVVGKIAGEEVDLAWQLRDALGQASAPFGQGVDLSTGSDHAEKLLAGVGGALAKLPQARLITGGWQLLRLLVARAPLVIEGIALPSGRRGAGLSLTVARGRHVIRTITLWQQTYELGPVPPAGDDEDDPPDPPWDRLAIAGAAWAQYVWLDWIGGPGLTAKLGTADWQSYAYLQVGLEVLTRDADRDLAQALFALAVDRDPANRQALFNLAVVDRRRGEVQQAIERLQRLECDLAR